ncbi:MAG: ribose ABC transporter permease [Spirochaetota bacterium]
MPLKLSALKSKTWLMDHRALIGLLVFVLIVSVLNPNFLTINNILNVLRQISVNFVLAMGMTFVILAGGIDLAVGSLLAFAGVVFADLIVGGQSLGLAVFLVLLLGLLVGILSGALISYCKLQPFILTLIGMTLFRGLTMIFTAGKPITINGDHSALDLLGSGSVWGVPIPVYLMALVFTASWYTLHHTRIGRYVYALGGNEEAAFLSGINTRRVKMFTYGVSGLLSALGAVILTSRLFSAQPNAGSGYELDAIAAVVLGGTSLAGGSGKVWGTLQGVLILGLLGNALNILNVTSYYQMVIKAAVILVAVLSDRIEK